MVARIRGGGDAEAEPQDPAQERQPDPNVEATARVVAAVAFLAQTSPEDLHAALSAAESVVEPTVAQILNGAIVGLDTAHAQ